ncbi:hypothetical protein CKO25_08980 [Thiocapsa imhoffii]|uniref:Uncharacterized protein n=1 Tax=Thiocapsa imhoffii TaxID=382777 RepID=A0A9X1B977_9GAMM|nr:hypothetical protein [Thiocapsa imhoffii]MBK1644780.1 hypothetical protein [Thiocapsa imhoffii]
MPFIGVRPGREALFQPQPRTAVAVNDAAAWRLNPRHRNVYDKLALALSAGLRAAPCGVDPRDLGIDPGASVFVKPIVNLAGMALNARAVPADAVPSEPGCFWCEHLTGPHTSSDCLVRDGEPIWFAHTRGADEKDQERPLYWEVGADLTALEPAITDWVRRHLAGYTGLCNLEMIGGKPIEGHLRGSNGFFDFYGPGFIPAWVALVDGDQGAPPPPIPGGYVLSVFGEAAISSEQCVRAAARGVRVELDPFTSGRAAVLRCTDKAVGLAVLHELAGHTV